VKKLIILIIKKKNEKNLTIRKFSKQKKKVQTLPSGRTHKLWFWLKGIARWDLRLAQPHTRVWFWLKGIVKWDHKFAQPHTRFWFWLKRIVRWDRKLTQPHTWFFFWLKGTTDTTKRLMSSPKCRSVEVINNPARPGLNHREVNCINYKQQ